VDALETTVRVTQPIQEIVNSAEIKSLRGIDIRCFLFIISKAVKIGQCVFV